MSNVFKYKETNVYEEKRVIMIKPFLVNRLNEEPDLLEETKQTESLANELDLLRKQKEELMLQIKNERIQFESYMEEQKEIFAAKKAAFEEEVYMLSEQAKKEGYERGIEIGKEEMFLAYENHIEKAKIKAAAVQKRYEEHLEQSEEIFISIGMQIAEEIVQTSLQSQKELLLPVIKKALTEVRGHSQITLYTHSENYELIQAELTNWQECFPKETMITIVVDDVLAVTDIVIETPYGQIDASIATQLELVKEKLQELVERKY